MRYLLSRAATADIEDAAEGAGVDRATLMQRAGAAAAAIALSMEPIGRITVLCGPGNNGGDGWVAAKELKRRGRAVEVLSAVAPQSLRGIAHDAAMDAIGDGVPYCDEADAQAVAQKLEDTALVVDALLGTGFAGELRDPVASWCSAVNDSDATVLSIDVPSGLDPDTGDSAWGAISATATMACIAVKPGMVGGRGGDLCGVVLADDLGCYDLLGEDAFTLHSVGQEFEASDLARLVPQPDPADNKYSRGTTLVVAGSVAFTGAAMMASLAAARVGAGYVMAAVPEPIVPILQTRLMSIPVHPLPHRAGVIDKAAQASIAELAGKARAVVIGPGLGRTSGVSLAVESLIDRCEAPVLVDADGLYVLSGMVEKAVQRAALKRKLVLTPHYGELLRLAHGAEIDTSSLPEHATDIALTPMAHAKLAVQVARAYGACIVAKGAVPVVTNGETTVFSADGSAALATAGTGDVLAGVIGGLLAQGLPPVEASVLGLRYGGAAATIAAERRTDAGVIAEDVIENLGGAILRTLGQ